jgi:hypothetical protein
VQVDPINPVLKAPGIKRLILIHDDPLSNVAFKSNLRRFIEGPAQRRVPPRGPPHSAQAGADLAHSLYEAMVSIIGGSGAHYRGSSCPL